MWSSIYLKRIRCIGLQMSSVLGVFFGFVGFLACSADKSDTGNAQDSANVVDDSSTDTTSTAGEGEVLFSQYNCNTCHTSSAPSFSSLISGMTADEIKLSIRDGSGTMPAFPSLTDAELDSLTQYLIDTYP